MHAARLKLCQQRWERKEGPGEWNVKRNKWGDEVHTATRAVIYTYMCLIL